MTTSVQRRRGSTTQHTAFTGLEGEITIDTTKDTAVVHDGSTVGGFPLAKESLENAKTTNLTAIIGTDTASDDTFLIYDASAGVMKKITRAELNNAIEVDALANVTITGGSIDGTTIGSTTASSGKFTTLESSSTTTLNGTSIPASKTLLVTTDIGTSVQAYDATILKSANIGVTVQGYDAQLADVAGLTPTDNGVIIGNGTNFVVESNSTLRTSLGLAIGTDVQAYDADLTTLGAGGAGARTFLGLGTAATTDATAYATAAQGAKADNALTTNNPSYTGTLTGGTGIVNLGSGQFYKDASGNIGVGTASPASASGYTVLQLSNATNGGLINFAKGSTIAAQFYNTANNLTLSTIQAGSTLTLNPYSGTIFQNAGVEAMRIDSSGNLLIGITSSPGAFNKQIVIDSGASAFCGIQLVNNVTGRAHNNGSVMYINSAGIFNIGNNYAAAMSFGTGGTERMRVTAGGRLLIGTTNEAYSGVIARQTIRFQGANNEYGLGFRPDADTTTAIWFANAAGSGVGNISITASATAYSTSSDYRLKENIAPMIGALDTVAKLKPVTYNWKADGSDGQGFIAHELQAVVPDCVTGEKDAVDDEGKPVYQGIDTSFLVATLVSAIQELKAEIDTLKGIK